MRAFLLIVGRLIALIGYEATKEAQGKHQAELACNSVHAGDNASHARDQLQQAGRKAERIFTDQESMTLAFRAATVERYLCTIHFDNSKVVRKEISHWD